MKANLCPIRFVAAIVMAVGLAITAHAQTVLLDFGNSNSGSFRGVSVPNPDPNGNYWNSLQPGLFYAAGSLVDVNNNATTLQFGFDGTPVGTDSYNGPAGAIAGFPKPTAAEIAATDIDAAALGNLGVKEAAIDYANSVGGGQDCRFQIQGLNTALTYDLTLFASHKYTTDVTTVFSVFNENTYSTLIGTANLDVRDAVDGSLHNRDTVATIAGLSPDANGILYVRFIGTSGAEGYLNSMQLTAIPEPSALLLLVGGAVVLVGFRRH